MNNKTDRTEEEINEGYKKAVESAIQKAPVRSGDRVYLTDLWAITSIPEEIIIETLASCEIKLPPEAKCIVDDRRKKKRVLYGEKETKEQSGAAKQSRIRKVPRKNT